ncbi:MAG: site-specific integrase [Methylotenera sp.]|nr:site-specific integrase [Methylotenera sp.]
MASITLRGEYQWQVQIRRKGHTLSKTFYYKQDAEVWARKTESEIDRGIFINTNEAERTSLSKLIDRYKLEKLNIKPKDEETQDRKKKPVDKTKLAIKAQAQEVSRLNIIEKAMGNKIIATITTSDIIQFRNSRLKTIQANSANREITTLKRLLSFANDDCKIILPHGVPSVKKLPVDDARERRVSDAEIEAICNNTNSVELPNIMRLALYTAMRRGEISNLIRSNIDFNVPSAKLMETKNGKNRIAPLMPAAAKLLKALPARIDGFVFSLRDRQITQAFERAVDRARKQYETDCESKGIEPDHKFLTDLRFHDLRHEATSRLALLLPNVIELSRVTGHNDLKMLSRYYQISVTDLAKKLG